jgi:hypothetical protein
MRFDPALARLFSGSHFYCTTLMPNWRVKQHSELAYGSIRLLYSGSMLLFDVGETKVFIGGSP